MATTAVPKSKTTLLMRVGLMIGGLKSNPPAAAKSILLQGKALTIAQIIASLVVIQTLLQAVATARSTLSKAVLAAKAQATANHALLAALRTALIQAYGPDTEGLAACGIVVKPRAKRTSQQATIAAAKAAATRIVNGTGKKGTKPTHTVTVTDASGQVVGGAAAAPTGAMPAASNEPAAAPAAVGK